MISSIRVYCDTRAINPTTINHQISIKEKKINFQVEQKTITAVEVLSIFISPLFLH